MSARNFLRSDVFIGLAEKCKVLVVSPLSKDPNFIEEFGRPGVTFEDLPVRRSKSRSVIEKLLFVLQTYWFTKKNPIETLMMLKNDLARLHPIRYLLYVVYSEITGRIPFFERALENLYLKEASDIVAERLLRHNNVDLVFATHGYAQEEMSILLAARKMGIPVVMMIHSWDNITSKSGLKQMTSSEVGRLLPVRLVDRFIVWNEIMADELRDMYGVSWGRIFISGIPQFDSYMGVEKLVSREEFFKKLGMDPDKKVLFLLATAPSLVHDQTVVVKTIIDVMRSGALAKSSQVLIRFHPRTDMRDWIDLFKGPDVFFQQPSVAFGALPVKSGWTKEGPASNELGEALAHSDIVINGMSTSALDAAVFDKPIICFGFDGDPVNNKVVPLYYKNTHYAKLLALGGIRVAWNPDQLVDCLNVYLKDSTVDAAGRKDIREKECFRLDGKAGERIAEFVLEYLGGEK